MTIKRKFKGIKRWEEMVDKWFKIVQRRCALCLAPSGCDVDLCKVCEARLPWLGEVCLRCALPFTHTQDGMCFVCAVNPPPYERLHALFDYRWPLSHFISRLKYQGDLYFATWLGILMATRLTVQNNPDVVIPVPLHRLRQRERGFNQTLELARVIVKKKKWKLDPWGCTRGVNTRKQSSLRAPERIQNLRQAAFIAQKSFEGKQVLVIEDVVTTGATAVAFSNILKEAGAVTVEIWACCRTLI